jgi:Na+/proline symporter
MSTFDTQVFVFAQTVSRNVIKKTQSEKGHIWLTRSILLATLALLALIASTVENIISFLFSAITVISVLAPVLFFHAVKLIDRDRKTDFWISMILVVSTGVYGYMFATGKFENFLFLIVPATISLMSVSAFILIRRACYLRSKMNV